MNNFDRFLLFLLVCIPVRLIYAFIQNRYVFLNWISGIIGAIFIYKWYTWNGELGGFGGKLWWNNMRLIHGIIYIFSVKYPILLYYDVVLGFIAKLYNYYL